jgi:hypothetical protein
LELRAGGYSLNAASCRETEGLLEVTIEHTRKRPALNDERARRLFREAIERKISSRSAGDENGESAVDGGHVRLVVARAAGGGEVVQPSELVGAELDSVRRRVLLDPGDPLRAGDRGDIVALCE